MPIRLETRDAVAWATIDRPEVLNALDLAHLEELLAVFRTAAEDEEVAVLVLTGAGRAFSAGADIKAMARMSAADFARQAEIYQELSRTARGLDKPILGAINGYAIGGGFEIALMCDLRIAGRSASFRLPDAEHGFSPTGGLTYLLPRIVGHARALDLLLTCRTLDAEAAERFGLVGAVLDDAALLAGVAETAARLAACPRLGLSRIKRALNAAWDSDFEAALALEQAYDAVNAANAETKSNLDRFVAARRK